MQEQSSSNPATRGRNPPATFNPTSRGQSPPVTVEAPPSRARFACYAVEAPPVVGQATACDRQRPSGSRPALQKASHQPTTEGVWRTVRAPRVADCPQVASRTGKKACGALDRSVSEVKQSWEVV